MSSFNTLIGIDESNLSDIKSIDKVTESSCDDDYAREGFDFLIEFNSDYVLLNKNFYKSLLESNGEVSAVQEAYADFFSGVKEIIDRFVNFIKSVFDKFVSKLSSFIQSEKYLIKNKDKFKNFDSDDSFMANGYNYTFDPNIPLIDLTIKFDSALLGDISSINTSDLNGDGKAKSAVDKLHKDLRIKLENDYYDMFRATVIGTRGAISESNFLDECFKIYRSGNLEPETISVNRSYIEAALNRIEKYKDTIRIAENTKNNIIKEYNDIRKKLDKMIKPNSTDYSDNYCKIDLIGFDANSTLTDVSISYDTLSSIDSYLKTISNQVQEMSNIHSIAFTSKIDAIKEQYKQDKSFLYQALAKCNPMSKVDESVDYNLDNDMEVGPLWII